MLSAVFCSLLFLCPAKAQDNYWDSILDRYEFICNECIDLKIRAVSGETITSGQISPLLESLREIRKEIRDNAGAMSLRQKARFERIRKSYNTGVKLAPCPSIDSLSSDGLSGRAVVCSPFSDVIRINPFYSTIAVRKEKKTDVTLSYSMGLTPAVSYGARLSVSGHRTRWGGYLGFNSNFTPGDTDYEFSSDGSLYGGSFWASGARSISVTRISAGARKLFGKRAGVYLGAGWGQKTTAWEDVNGRWAKVIDRSSGGLLLECGAIIELGPLEMHAGISSISFTLPDIEIGIGIRL